MQPQPSYADSLMSDAVSLGDTLDEAMQHVLDDLAGALASNDAAQRAAINAVTGDLKAIVRKFGASLQADLAPISNALQAQVAAGTLFTQQQLDAVAAQLAAVKANAGNAAGATPQAIFPVNPAQWAIMKPVAGPCYALAPGQPQRDMSDVFQSAYNDAASASAALIAGVGGCVPGGVGPASGPLGGAWFVYYKCNEAGGTQVIAPLNEPGEYAGYTKQPGQPDAGFSDAATSGAWLSSHPLTTALCPNVPPGGGPAYNVYQDVFTDQCYFIIDTLPPRNLGDVQLATGLAFAAAVARAEQCGNPPPATPTYTVWRGVFDGICYFLDTTLPPNNLGDTKIDGPLSADAAKTRALECDSGDKHNPDDPKCPPQKPCDPIPPKCPDLPPAPPPGPKCAPIDCAKPVAFDTKITPFAARIGSAEWCKSIGVIELDLSGIGGGFIAWINNSLPQFAGVDCNPPTWFEATFAQLPFGIGCALENFWRMDANLFNTFTATLKTAVSAGLNISAAVTCDNPALTVSLVVVRAVLQSLRNFRIGTDAGLWATIDITVKWDQAEAAIDYLIKHSCPYLIPSASEAMSVRRGGWISDSIYSCWMGMNGHDVSVYSPLLEHGRPRGSASTYYTLYHRLRNGTTGLANRFDDAALMDALQKDGYNEEWVKRLFDLRYIPYTLREIRQLLDASKITRDETYAAFRDMGYDDEKANAQADMEMVLTTRRRAAEVQGNTPSHIAHVYGRGVIDVDEVRHRMTALSFSYDDSVALIEATKERNLADAARKWGEKASTMFLALLEENYKLGLVSAAVAVDGLMKQGALKDSALSIVATWADEVQLINRKNTIKFNRTQWLSGRISNTAALLNLESIGMTGAAAYVTLSAWQAEQVANAKELSGAEVLRLVAEGMLSPVEAATRLANLDFANTDADILIAEASNKLRAANVKAQQSQETARIMEEKAVEAEQRRESAKKAVDDARAAKAASTLIKEAEKARKDAVAALRRATPVATLNRWLKRGLIGVDLYAERMTQLGYPEQEIDAYVQDISDSKGAAVVETGPILDLGTPQS